MSPRSNFLLGADQKSDARSALEILAGSGVSLSEAARLAIAGRRAVKNISVRECANLFLHDRLLTTRGHTYAWYESKIGAFVSKFGGFSMNEVTKAKVREWVGSLEAAEGTKRSHARAVRVFWNWASAQEPALAGEDVTAGMEVSAERPETITFLSVAEVEAILDRAGKHLAPISLCLFAGIRPHEVAGVGKPPLTWGCLNIEERIIRIPAEIAKTGYARIVEGLPETLWRWLPSPGKPSSPIASSLAPSWQELGAYLAGFGRRTDRRRKWPHDAYRHTFATYAVAFTSDASKVSLWLGHMGSPALLHRHYRGLTTRTEGEKFFGLAPKAAESRVLEFPA
jgi:integrase